MWLTRRHDTAGTLGWVVLVTGNLLSSTFMDLMLFVYRRQVSDPASLACTSLLSLQARECVYGVDVSYVCKKYLYCLRININSRKHADVLFIKFAWVYKQ